MDNGRTRIEFPQPAKKENGIAGALSWMCNTEFFKTCDDVQMVLKMLVDKDRPINQSVGAALLKSFDFCFPKRGTNDWLVLNLENTDPKTISNLIYELTNWSIDIPFAVLAD